MRKFPELVQVYLSTPARDAIRSKAIKHNITLSGYIRHLIMADLGLPSEPLNVNLIEQQEERPGSNSDSRQPRNDETPAPVA